MKAPGVAVVLPSAASFDRVIEMIGSLSLMAIVAAVLFDAMAYDSAGESVTTTRSTSSASASSTDTMDTRSDLTFAGITTFVATGK